MARSRSPNRDKAFEIYKENNGNIDLVEIASILNVSSGTVRGWKNKDKWENHFNGTLQKNKRNVPNKKGGQPKNKNAETHGFFSKHLPRDTLNIINEIKIKNPLDILWENIQIQYAAIIRAQNIMYVKSQDDLSKELKKEINGESAYSTEYEIQFAWDKQATFLQAQSRAMKTLESLIKQYEELLNKGLATEEQKARIEVLKSKVNTPEESKEDKIDKYLGALEEVIKED